MNRLLPLLILIFFSCNIFAQDKFVVVIDAGHGGKDAGAVRNNIKEKDINLQVAVNLGKLIENNHKDVKVIYTRKTDVFVDLAKRAQIANKAKANLFISIHTNSTEAKKTSVAGADTYILGLARSEENLRVAQRENSVILLEDNYKQKYENFDPKSPESYIIFEFMTNKYLDQSLEMASHIQTHFKTVAKRTDRGVRQAGFLVLRETAMPSVLIELGFINNPTEAKYLSSSAGQSKMARAIYAGFAKYKKEFDKKKGGKTNNSVAEKEDEISDVVLSGTEETELKNADQDKVEYRIQILMSPKKLAKNTQVFKGLAPVDFYMDGTTYKYTYGSTYSKAEALDLQRKARTKFKDAFIVEFKNGKRIK